MRFKLYLILLAFPILACEPAVEKAPATDAAPKKKLVIDKKGIKVYALAPNAVIDSAFSKVDAFTSFRSSIEDLSKLNPRGLGPFLSDAYRNTNNLLQTRLPDPFEKPDIRSRLKVVKTQLLRVNYFSNAKEYDLMNESLADLYQSYNAFLMRIEDFADLETEENSEEEIELNKLPVLE